MKCLWLLNIGTIELEGARDLLMVYINWDHELGGACEMLGVNNNWNPELRGNQALIHKGAFKYYISTFGGVVGGGV